jgi:hypothetical protein
MAGSSAAGHPAPQTSATGMHTRTRRNLRSAALPMIAKTFIIAKLFRSHSANFFRQDKSPDGLGDKPDCPM